MKIAVTGPRPDKLGGYDALDNFRAIRRNMLAFLENEKSGDPELSLISGGALGIDQFWIQVGLHLNLPITVALPFEGYDSKWPAASRQKYRDLLDKCSCVRYVCEPGYSAAKLQKRNEWMVQHCDKLAAYCFPGLPGGTKNCIDYAKEQDCSMQEFDLREILA